MPLQWCGCFRGPWISFAMTDEFGSQKLLQWLVSHELTAYRSFLTYVLREWIIVILSKRCKPDNFESRNSLKPSFTNIWGFHSNFVEFEHFLESNSPGILAICETNLDYSTNSGNFSVSGYFLLTWKNFYTHMDGLAVCVKEGLSFAQDLLSPENFADSYLCFQLALLHTVFYLCFLYGSPFLSLKAVFVSISFNINETLLINPSDYVFVC